MQTTIEIDGRAFTANWIRSEDAGYSKGRLLLDLPNGDTISVYRVGRRWVEAIIRDGICRSKIDHATRTSALHSATEKLGAPYAPDMKREGDMMQLMQGDCMEVMKQIPDGSIDMILCDLPYGTTACKWDTVIPFEPLWEQYRRIAKRNAAIVLTGSQPFSSALVSSAFDLFKYSWVWVKNRPTGAQHSKNRPMSNHEDVLVFSQAPMGHASQLGERRMKYSPQGVSVGPMKTVSAARFGNITGQRPNQYGKNYQSITGLPHTVLNFGKDESHYHPTQKPVALMEYLIRTYTNEGEVVLDNCMGSGSTGVAAVRCGRRFIGIEMDARYFEAAKSRIQEEEARASSMIQFTPHAERSVE